jgi:hypothetical protein
MQSFFKRLWGSAPQGSIHTPSFHIPSGKDSWEEFGWSNRLPHDHELTTWDGEHGRDVYFAPVRFNGRRQEANALPTQWCWADLDLADPHDMSPLPTVAWESSPGRWHAMWEMTEEIPAVDASHMSKRIAFHVGADRGGWDITQVLRVPGTHNYKYPGPAEVKLLWDDGPVWSLAELSSICPDIQREESVSPAELSDETPVAIVSQYTLSRRAQELLSAVPGPEDDRSLKLVELSHHLAEAGMGVGEIIVVTRASPWNKFAGRTDELLRLSVEARKAVAKHPHTVARLADLPDIEWQHEVQARQPIDAGWLIKDIWHANTQGVIGGEAKSFKSILTMEMAQAVASGNPFLGKYPVHRRGPVLIVQEENDRDYYLPDLLNKITRARGTLPNPAMWQEGPDTILSPAPMLPIAYLNQTGFTFESQERMDHVEELIRRVQPVLVIFDSMYSMLGSIDETKAHEIRPILTWLREIKKKHQTAVVLCHHWRKKQGRNDNARAGQRLSGSNNFHNWIESALYVTRPSDDDPTVIVEREFRRAMVGKFVIRFDIGEFGDTNAYTTTLTNGASTDAQPQGS